MQQEEWGKATHPLVPLAIGTVVSVQNQRGPNKTKWDNSGVIVECLPHSQYKVKLDGTGHVTLRNRVTLRCIIPYSVSNPIGRGLELKREASTGVGRLWQAPPHHLLWMAPRVLVIPVSQEDSEASEEARGLVAPEATHTQSLVIPQGLPMEKEVSSPVVKNDSADIVPRKSS